MKRDEQKSQGPPSLPERVSFVVTLLIVLTVVGALAADALSARSRRAAAGPPAPMAEARIDWGGVAEKREGERRCWLVPITVANVGQVPLVEVGVVVEVVQPDGEAKEADVTLTYLAERARETVYVVAERRPVPETVSARVATLRIRQNARGY
jgi:Protein of unknown function (DUF2393).